MFVPFERIEGLAALRSAIHLFEERTNPVESPIVIRLLRQQSVDCLLDRAGFRRTDLARETFDFLDDREAGDEVKGCLTIGEDASKCPCYG